MKLLAILLALAGAARSPPHAGPTCHARGLLPDPACTPGAVATTDLAIICGTRTKGRRRVSTRIRHKVMAAYGYAAGDRSVHVDHLVPLELGGANTAANLWPEPLGDSKRKDRIEDREHRLVCTGRVSVTAAQAAMARDWTRAAP